MSTLLLFRFKQICRPKRCRNFASAVSDIFEGININRNVIRVPEVLPVSVYGGRRIVTMIPGTAPGPELMKYVKEVFTEVRAPIDFEMIESQENESSDDYTARAITSIRRNSVGIKGNMDPTPSQESEMILHPNVTLRSTLDLYVSIVHCKSYENIESKHKDVDIVVFRQNTEGEYAMLEHAARKEPGKNIVVNLKIITRDNTERLARWAFEYAKLHKRKKITIVHKANIMKISDGLFKNTVQAVGAEYKDIALEEMIVDNCSMQIVNNPKQFDILIAPNLYGNVIVSILCGLLGGAGTTSDQNYGKCCAVFETAGRHIFPLKNGEIIVNPISMLNASINLLYHLHHNKQADLIKRAIKKTVSEDCIQTEDIGGTNTAQEMVANIQKLIRNNLR